MTAAQPPKRVRPGHLAWVGERLSERDWSMVETVNRLHLVTGSQLDRLHFPDLDGRSRLVSRSRALARLTRWRVLLRLPRRIGGAQRGSSVAVYALDTAGQRLLAERTNQTSSSGALVRRPGAPSERFVAHVLAVSELYVQLVEADREGLLHLREYVAEPAAWWPNGLGSWLKPDAYLVVSNGRVDHLWWIEVDRATESPEAVKRKLRAYLDFVRRGQLGPREAIPRVLITVPNEARRRAVSALVARLPLPADELCHVVPHEDAVCWLADALRG